MKISKKLAFIALALSLMMVFTACGGVVENTDEESSAATTESAAVSESVETSASAEVSEVLTLTMATNAAFPPYEYLEGEVILGIDAEIAALIAEKLGMELKIENMEFDSAIISASTGKTDMVMAGLTITEERQESLDFTTSYATGKQVIIVPEDSDIAQPSDLEGKTIGAQLATTGDLYVTWDYVDTGLSQIERYNTGVDAVLALVQGKIDAVVIDNEPAKVFVAQNEGLKILETEYIIENYAIGVKKGNTELLDKINTALEELIASGDVQTIIDKYIKAD